MEKKVLEATKLATLVFYGPIYGVSSIPHIGQYLHRNIKKVVPCEVVNNQYRSLRTGCLVEKTGNVVEWPLLRGTVLAYEDGKQFLLSRRYADQKLLFMEVVPEDFHPTMVKVPIRGQVI